MSTYIFNGGGGGAATVQASLPSGYSTNTGSGHSSGGLTTETVYALPTLFLVYRLTIFPRTSYKITAQVHQINPAVFFHVVEQTVMWKGAWNLVDGAYVLTMPGSGTCGSLRFVSDTGEDFVITLGVHNYKRWGDIVTDLDYDNTGVTITPQYYGGRTQQREKQLTTYNVNNVKGRNFQFNYTVAKGNDLKVKIIIG